MISQKLPADKWHYANQVFFDFENHFLYTDDEMPQYFLGSKYNTVLDSQHSNRYKWLSNPVQSGIEDNKDLSLSFIHIEERIEHLYGSFYSEHSGDLPETVRDMRINAKVHLYVGLRAAKELNPESR